MQYTTKEYELSFKEIQDGLHVLHHCDNPPCVNPDHLFLGTSKDNMDDKVKKGRARWAVLHGEANGSAKLTDSKVAEIRLRHENGESNMELSKGAGVSRRQISNIVNFRNWKSTTK